MARLAVISDIHGNRVALEEVLRDIDHQDVDAVLCLGDIVGYGPEPAECIDLVRRNCRLSIRGNHEDGVLDRGSAEGWNPIARTAIAYTRKVLADADLDFLSGLPASFSVSKLILAVHDTPVPNEHGMSYLRASRDAADAFFWIRESICLVGHTHVPACFRTNTGASVRPHVEDVETAAVSSEISQETLDAAEASRAVRLPREGRTILNPGSVGQPRDRDPRASYCVLDLSRSVVEFRRVAYDIEEAMRRTIAVGLPTVLGERLALGA